MEKLVNLFRASSISSAKIVPYKSENNIETESNPQFSKSKLPSPAIHYHPSPKTQLETEPLNIEEEAIRKLSVDPFIGTPKLIPVPFDFEAFEEVIDRKVLKKKKSAMDAEFDLNSFTSTKKKKKRTHANQRTRSSSFAGFVTRTDCPPSFMRNGTTTTLRPLQSASDGLLKMIGDENPFTSSKQSRATNVLENQDEPKEEGKEQKIVTGGTESTEAMRKLSGIRESLTIHQINEVGKVESEEVTPLEGTAFHNLLKKLSFHSTTHSEGKSQRKKRRTRSWKGGTFVENSKVDSMFEVDPFEENETTQVVETIVSKNDILKSE